MMDRDGGRTGWVLPPFFFGRFEKRVPIDAPGVIKGSGESVCHKRRKASFLSNGWFCMFSWGLLENTSLIKKKSFWVPPFDRKRRRLLKLFRKRFTKNLYDFSVLLRTTFKHPYCGIRDGNEWT
ncbi:hypothetical protein [Novacetimonas hansenii]|uniref:hypothetical protein n=1 Tax=Novacetimonas hansenii TaxID=436 RepID=UPI00117B31AE|nr:hypothetical protein [Novacetimonas hansenii]WEQ58714.1 hypothetical protein LV563_12925 [Novacetimonas hansenii]